jgi:hypothetical protein
MPTYFKIVISKPPAAARSLQFIPANQSDNKQIAVKNGSESFAVDPAGLATNKWSTPKAWILK